MKLDILAIGAHPDDVELCASGTLLKHISKGYKVGILDLSRGELGTRGNAELRMQEAAKAAKILGLSIRETLDMADGFFQNDKDHQLQIIKIIRKYRPEVILGNAVSDRHPDHGRAGKLIADSCFYSGLIKIETELDGKPQKPWRPVAVYHYIQDYYIIPDLVVDISAFYEKRVETIMAYASQFHTGREPGEPETPISSPQFLEFLRGRTLSFGRLIGSEYGEGFTVSRAVGVEDLLELK
jgi:N-acetylglucosamine malate deacetylase 1